MTEKNAPLLVMFGAVTGTTVGTFIFQAVGTILLGILGALGGYIFIRFIKPRLDRISLKKDKDKLDKLERKDK